MGAVGVDPYLSTRLGESKQASGLEVRFNCPECIRRRNSAGLPDREMKLYVNFAKGLFHCIRCGWKGSVKFLYTSLGLQPSPQHRPLPADLKEVIGALEDPNQESELSGVPVAEDVSPCKLPAISADWQYQDAWLWLWNRLQTVPQDEVLALVESQVIVRGVKHYWDRVFFVDRYHGQVRYWTARAYVDGVKPKYLNPYGVPRNNVMFNQERLEKSGFDEVIICEGVISAIVAGPNAVATYGRCVTTQQIDILDSLRVRRYVIASEPDRDAKKNTLALAEALRSRSKEVLIVDCPAGKDPADLGRSTFQTLLEQARPFNWSTSITRRIEWIPN